ncbi:MAG: nucleotide sugar dehydrogenase, partial [Anaerolineae bacterium]|nr:nucleotide sugar dehydrogenase [Anaerolineae bacterium]
MDIAFVGGAGRLGSALAAHSAIKGHRVTIADIDEAAVAAIGACQTQGRYGVEPGVSGLLNAAVSEGKLRATTGVAVAAEFAELITVIVPTPSDL